MPRLPSKVISSHATNMAAIIMNVSEILLAISFGIQNCNSLNISTSCPKQTKKLRAILDIDTDIVFLSDIRLNNSQENIRDIENIFLSGGSKQYKFIYNSSMAKRGVGILISNQLSFDLIEDFHDTDENILGLHCKVNGTELLMISIYGPNNDNLSFFENLTGPYIATKKLTGDNWGRLEHYCVLHPK